MPGMSDKKMVRTDRRPMYTCFYSSHFVRSRFVTMRIILCKQ